MYKLAPDSLMPSLPEPPIKVDPNNGSAVTVFDETITGKTFPFPDKSLPVTERIIDNLGSVL